MTCVGVASCAGLISVGAPGVGGGACPVVLSSTHSAACAPPIDSARSGLVSALKLPPTIPTVPMLDWLRRDFIHPLRLEGAVAIAVADREQPVSAKGEAVSEVEQAIAIIIGDHHLLRHVEIGIGVDQRAPGSCRRHCR